MAVTHPAGGVTTKWRLKGTGYEFCNCSPGCTCNFSGFPSAAGGSCKALVTLEISEGTCGDVDLAGTLCAAALEWPGAIHEGNGKIVFIVRPEATEKQVEALGGIFTGKLGGNPWEILGTTYEVAGMERADIRIDEKGRHSSVTLGGLGEARGDTLKNPVTGEDNNVSIELETGFIWKRGECGQGSFKVRAGGLDLDFEGTSWVHYSYEWSN